MEYLTVSQITYALKGYIDNNPYLKDVLILGEISNFKDYSSGHLYFSLKDENSSLKCVQFSFYRKNNISSFKNGDLVLARGSISIYEANGTYQLYVKTLSLFGEGEYLLKLQKLKEKLASEGVFSREKKTLPYLVKKVGVITSLESAAIHDFLTSLYKRMPLTVYIFPSLVQGDEAPNSLIKAVDEAMKYDLDCIVITRGGGSKEDLRCFNDEMFLRKCLELKIPLISAVGHEIDTTLLDYISDIQSITPTQAAEKVSNPLDYFKDELNNLDALLNRDFILYIEKQTERLFNYERLIESFSLKEKLNSYLLFILKDQERLNIYINRYLNDIIFDLNLKKEKLDKAFLNRLNNSYDELKSKESIFNSLSPFKALERGYSLIYKENNVITSKSQLKKGDIITINLKDGSLKAVIKENEEDL